MLRIGLTGGIGCGKSTVAAMMRALGCHVLEADKMAHQLIEPGQPAYDAVIREFGRDICAPAAAPQGQRDARPGGHPDGHSDGRPHERIDRAKLAAIVFADPAQLARLNAIVHPPLLAEIDRELSRLESSDPGGIAVIDAALLIEFNHYKRLDRIVVVWCTPEQQLARLTDRSFGRGMPREQAQGRIAAQLDLQAKRKLADDVIDCSGTFEETRRQVESLVTELKRRAAVQAR
jgi:dephospho-CoA kinase